MSINENIDVFYDYFRDQLSSARCLERPLNRKIVCVAIIDALAGIRFSTAGNRERFVGVIDHCGAWEYADRISIHQLELVLKAKRIRGSLYIPAKRFNSDHAAKSDLGSDPDFSQFPNDFTHVDTLWLCLRNS
jgi:hypothetical protein